MRVVVKMANTLPPKLPVLYIPHGGGPCFFMDPAPGPPGTWTTMETFLRLLPTLVGILPRAILMVTAHWEETICSVQGAEKPGMLYDYYGFPDYTYELKYEAPGEPLLAERVRELLTGAGIQARIDPSRGFDHGTFVPLMVSYPKADIPVVQLSLLSDFNPSAHIAIGKALQPLREDGVLIIGSGSSYHNLGLFFSQRGNKDAKLFDDWLTETVSQNNTDRRNERLVNWERAPGARAAHPREEHLLPLHVCAGAAGSDIGSQCHHQSLLGKAISAYRFG